MGCLHSAISSRIQRLESIAVGHYRNGVLLAAPLTAELVSKLVAGNAGDDPALATLSPNVLEMCNATTHRRSNRGRIEDAAPVGRGMAHPSRRNSSRLRHSQPLLTTSSASCPVPKPPTIIQT